MLVVELHELVSYLDASLPWLVPQGFEVSGGEVVIWVFWVGKRFIELRQSPVVTLQILLVF